MTTQTLNPGTATALTFSGLNSLSNGSSDTSTAFDLADGNGNVPLELDIEVKLDGASASSTDACEVYYKRSIDGTDFPDDGNDELIGVVQMNGASAVVRVIRLSSPSQHGQIRVENNSGDALAASGNSVAILPYTGDSQ